MPFRPSSMFITLPRAFVWPAAALLLAVVAVAIVLLAMDPGVVRAQSACTDLFWIRTMTTRRVLRLI